MSDSRGKVAERSLRGEWERYWRVVHRVDPKARSPQDLFLDRVLERIPGRRWLDAGCGRESFPHWRREELARVETRFLGCDLDLEALHESVAPGRVCQATLEALPFADASFDVVTSNMVFEHLDRPEAVVTELLRVTAPGGRILVHTVNALHYQAWAARLTPHRVHERVVSRLEGRAAKDVYPVRYRANTDRSLRRLFESCGGRVVSGGPVPDVPLHLPYPGLFWIGIGLGLLERVLARLPGLGALLRANLILEVERPRG